MTSAAEVSRLIFCKADADGGANGSGFVAPERVGFCMGKARAMCDGQEIDAAATVAATEDIGGSEWRDGQLAGHPDEGCAQALQEESRPTERKLLQNHQLINQTSGEVEWWTPPIILRCARESLFGRIDLDPASSAAANAHVRAGHIFTLADDGLKQPWYGHVWMNHPFSRKFNAAWINKLIEEYTAGRVHAACCITYASTSEAWFTPLMGYPQCYLIPRTNYLLPDGTVARGATKGSVLTYLGAHVEHFVRVFETQGVVMVPHGFNTPLLQPSPLVELVERRLLIDDIEARRDEEAAIDTDWELMDDTEIIFRKRKRAQELEELERLAGLTAHDARFPTRQPGCPSVAMTTASGGLPA